MSEPAYDQEIDVWPTSRVGWIASLSVAWALAGGVAAMLLVAALILTGRLHSMDMLLLAGAVAGIASVFGAVHGGLLGLLGKAEAANWLSWRKTLFVVVSTVAACCFSVAFGMWIGISTMAARSGYRGGIIALVVAAPIAVAILAWATVLGWHAMEIAYARWPEKRLGSRLVIGATAVLSLFMLLLRGAIPGTDIQLSAFGAIVLVAVAVVWIVSPAVILSLRLNTYAHPGRGLDR